MLRRKFSGTAGFVFTLLVATNGQTGFAFTKTGTIYSTDGSQADVVAAIANAANGDTVGIPAGSFTWGAAGSSISLNKPITMKGAGTGQTFINLSATGPSWASGVIRIGSAASVINLTINGANSGNVAAFACGADGWKIAGVDFKGGTDSAYFVYVGAGSGLINNCNIAGGNGSTELIFGRGPADGWQTPPTMGTINATYIEDCTFSGSGYLTDANANAKFVVRFCTINGQQKVDGHGKASNTPARGVRHMEVYGNRWAAGGYYTAIELRGGTAMVFDNTALASDGGSWLILTEYGSTALWPNFGNRYQTPANYPVDDQIGVGMDPKVAASEPMYLWNNQRAGTAWPLTALAIPAAAITQYGSAYTMYDIVRSDRDYFVGAAPFNGTSGVGTGTAAQMRAITPTKKNVGFWVTDEGEWNSRHAGPDGRLYVWNGIAWSLKYTPFTYPHPNAMPRPTAPKSLRIAQ
ncbi:MAG: hypothetical protein JWM16_743 [Verrucomicrobiales bacterium]|nr:hypothetical protein [Verrucomicrobiales bacterium]